MENIHFLEKLGLTARESKVYLALLEHGEIGVSAIARVAGLYRTDVYTALSKLEREGLVSIAPKGKYKVYRASQPKLLQRRFAELADEFDEQIAQLEKLGTKKGRVRPRITYVEGIPRIADIFDDVVHTLKRGDMFYRYSSTNVANIEKRRSSLSRTYRTLRDQKQIERRVITNPESGSLKRPRLGREVKVIPPEFDLFKYDVTQLIYADKVAVIDYNTETAVVIENPTIARFQAKIFELLYKKL